MDRDSLLHALVYQRPELVKTREIANNLIEKTIDVMLDRAGEVMRKACLVTPPTLPALRTFMMQRLKEKELSLYLVLQETSPFQACVLFNREANETILEPEEWQHKCQGH